MSDQLFISYRRNDEPFAVALLASRLSMIFGDKSVYLDTLRNRRARSVASRLNDAVAKSSVIVCLIGPQWDSALNIARLKGDEPDWVRLELRRALAIKRPIIPVYISRETRLSDGVPDDLKAALNGLHVPLGRRTEAQDTQLLAERIMSQIRASRGPALQPLVNLDPNGDSLALPDRRLTRVAVDAMQRHVLPIQQHASRNLDNLVSAIVHPTILPDGEWLEHAAVGALPGKPAGSALVVLTDKFLRISQLNKKILPEPPMIIPLSSVRNLNWETRPRKIGPSLITLSISTFAHSRETEVRGIFETPGLRLMELVQRKIT